MYQGCQGRNVKDTEPSSIMTRMPRTDRERSLTYPVAYIVPRISVQYLEELTLLYFFHFLSLFSSHSNLSYWRQLRIIIFFSYCGMQLLRFLPTSFWQRQWCCWCISVITSGEKGWANHHPTPNLPTPWHQTWLILPDLAKARPSN